MSEGIDTRHSRTCRSRDGGSCSCTPSYQAHVWSKRDNKRIRKTFRTRAAAKSWRADALVKVGQGTLRAATETTIREAGDALLSGMADGTIASAGESRTTLSRVMADCAETVERLRGRFPNDVEVSRAVDEFLTSAESVA